MNPKKFFALCADAFSFLAADYGMELVDTQKHSWGCRALFSAEACGVRITCEYREFFVFIQICQLVHGRFQADPGEIGPKTELRNFDLDDIITLRSSESEIVHHAPGIVYSEELFERTLRQQAQNVKRLAPDVLAGDFSLFPELDKVVKARARKFDFEEWGEKAREFGWE